MVDFRGPLDLRVNNAYPWVFAIGALISLLWLGLQPAKQESDQAVRIDAGLIALLAGLIGARIGYVATHWSYFSQRPDQAFYFWQGGLSWAAGAFGALIGLGVYVLLSRHSFWRLVDALAIPAAIVASAAWLGCLIDRCAYGFRTSPGLLTPPAPDMIGNISTTLAYSSPGRAALARCGWRTVLAFPVGSPSRTACSPIPLTCGFGRASLIIYPR